MKPVTAWINNDGKQAGAFVTVFVSSDIKLSRLHYMRVYARRITHCSDPSFGALQRDWSELYAR